MAGKQGRYMDDKDEVAMSRDTLLIGTERCTGRTTRAIQIASAFGATIVTPNERMARYVMERAGQIGRNVDAVSVARLVADAGFKVSDRIIVDDADTILSNLLHHPIAAMTICGTYLKDW